jgi:hypothetical protein
MKRAITIPAYKDTHGFPPPDGVTTVAIDPDTLQLATPLCPVVRQEVFVSGTEPTEYCSHHGGRAAADLAQPAGGVNVVTGVPANPPAPADLNSPGSAKSPAKSAPRTTTPSKATKQAPAATTPPEAEKKKGLLERIFGIFGGGKKSTDKPKPPPGN